MKTDLLNPKGHIFSFFFVQTRFHDTKIVISSYYIVGRKLKLDKRTSEDYYKESKRIREEVLQQADSLIGNPLRFTITNGITMDVEITKSDLKTIVSKASRDN